MPRTVSYLLVATVALCLVSMLGGVLTALEEEAALERQVASEQQMLTQDLASVITD